MLHIPFVDSTIRTGDVTLYGRWRSKAGLNRASLVVANTHCGLTSAGVGPARGRVIRNAFDFSRIPAEPPSRVDSRFTVVMAARMHPAKDWTTFFSAARTMTAEFGPGALRFLALGDGPDGPRLKEEAADLVNTGVLEFGYASDVIPQIRLADCGVLMTSSSRVEGCSNSILEYMACGLPVVCSRGGGTDEVIQHGMNGFLVPPGDAGQLVQWLRWIRLNPDAAAQIGLQAADIVRREYSIEAMVRATEAVYAEALARN
jgi:glycosyltransferase involved in cell wall biosynthesis